MKIDSYDKKNIISILEKIEKREKEINFSAIDFRDAYELFSEEEINLCEKFIVIKPELLGFKGEVFGIKKVPKNLVKIIGQKIKTNGEDREISEKLVSKSAYSAFLKLKKALKKDLDKEIFIESGYRSPVYQLFVFFYYLRFYKWNFKKTAKRVALPGCSEHGEPVEMALDFITENGIPDNDNPQKFAETAEYEWLMENAGKFGFYLSYPKNNKFGIMFEPWHWRYKKNNKIKI